MPKMKEINIKRAVELYEKYGSINRAALSLDCAPSTLKRFLVKNNIPIKKYVPKRWDIKFF